MSKQPVEREQGELDRLMERLGDLRKPVRPAGLHCLSDLSGDRLARFCEALAAYPVDRRRSIVHSLLALAESKIGRAHV